MPAAKIPDDEARRLQSLMDLGILDTGTEQEFDALVKAAALVCNVPISLVTLIDADRQWFKANVGLPGTNETPRQSAFCAHAILSDQILEVPDARLDARFADNPLVTGAPDIRFYAGTPLRLSDGTNAGTLCVIDRQPRQLSPTQKDVLAQLGIAAVQLLEGRRAMVAERTLRDTASNTSRVLLESESRFKALSEASPLGVFATDPQGTCTYTNSSWQTIYGLSLRQSLGDGWVESLHTDDRDAVLTEWRAATSQCLDCDLEFRIQRPDGETRSVRALARASYSADGVLRGYVGTIEDVTEQIAVREALIQSEQRLRQLYQATPAMLHSIDIQGRLLSVTDQWLETLGYERDEVIGKPSVDFLTETSRIRAKQELPSFFASGRCDNIPYQMVCKDGSLVDVLLSAVLERDVAGNPMHSMAVIRNVTAQRADQRMTDALMHTIRTQFISSFTDQCGVITEVNDAFCAISGYARGELIGADHRIVNSGLNGQGFFADMWQTLSRGESWRGEICNRAKNGNLYWVDSVIAPLPGRDGRAQVYVSIRVDITERKRQEQALRKSEKQLLRTSHVAEIGGWELDLRTNELDWSSQTREIHGVPPGFVPEVASAIAFYAPEARPLIQAAVELAMATGQGWDLELPFIQATGNRIWVRAVGAAEFEGDIAVRLVGTFQDVTKLHEAKTALARQHELLRVTLKSIGDAVITTDEKGQVNWLNPVAERMTGWLNSEANGREIGQVFHIVNEETRAPTENPVATCLEQGKIAGLANHTLLISRQGEEFGIEDSAAPIRNEQDEILGVVLVFHDVTEQRRLSGEMSFRATHDALTGLVNRAEFETRLRNVLNRAHEDRSCHALLFIDLDQFKLVNDACGHSIGDQLLQQVSKLLGEVVRARDTLARLGGDEFGVILEHCSAEQAQRVAQQICERMDDFRFIHDGKRFRIGASIGLVPVDNRWGNTAAVLQAADTSCYAAKEAGRNRVHAWFDTDMAMRARHGEMQWAARLEQALDDNRFVLFAQRIVSLDAARHGLHAEVLLRLVDQDGGLVQPGAFLPAAERFHLASRIDRWVLRNSIECLRGHADLSLIDTLCVNLSGQSIGDRAFHRQAFEILEQAGPAICQRICLEITETAAITNMADASVFIEQSRSLGIRIALDDFGAGASSFGYLKNLNVDLLKIDGQFIRNIIDDPLDDAAVRCFVDVAKVVGVKTVAEFVDRAEVLARVREIGIDFVQGYFLHRPEPIAQVLATAIEQTSVNLTHTEI